MELPPKNARLVKVAPQKKKTFLSSSDLQIREENMSCKSPFVSPNISMSLLMPSIDSNIILND
jgi:hypothetical protein